jgi:hypothetical protein
MQLLVVGQVCTTKVNAVTNKRSLRFGRDDGKAPYNGSGTRNWGDGPK